jgi:CRISPR/Cas system-associated exonuclease Cas4 (RecB family)
VLQAIHRLQPREEPRPVEELEPLVRGSLMHEVQYELMRELQQDNGLPLKPDGLENARARLDRILEAVAARYRDELAPAIPRVWEDGVLSVRTDLREWLRRQAEDASWAPWRFELSFGLPDVLHRDSHSTRDPAALEEGLTVRGSIDLVERDSAGALRATDYKSGRVRAEEGAVIGGGAILQPALYALALARLFPGATVQGGRLHYCTFAGEFTEVAIPLDRVTRESVAALARTVQGAVAQGFLPAAPRERECERCDYRSVCGPNEELRVRRKPQDRLAPLLRLREMP